MKSKKKNSLNPHEAAVAELAGVPRHCWDLSTVVTADLVVRIDMPTMQPMKLDVLDWLRRA